MSKIIGRFLDSAMFEQETLLGNVDGVNTSFTLSSTPLSNKSVYIYIDGLLTIDYSISGKNITMNSAPLIGQVLVAIYFKR